MKRAQKKTRPRPRLTHFEVHRNGTLMLRLAIAEDAGTELGVLIKKLVPDVAAGVQASVEAVSPDDAPTAVHHVNDVSHEDTRVHLVELVSSLCDTSLADAEEIVRNERARRMEGTN